MTPTPSQPSEELVEAVAEACANDESARAIANKGGTVAFADMDRETRDFWRCVARAALAAMPAPQAEVEQLRERVRDYGDAIDFAAGHCGPEEAMAFLNDWRMDRADEWPGFVAYRERQRAALRTPPPSGDEHGR